MVLSVKSRRTLGRCGASCVGMICPSCCTATVVQPLKYIHHRSGITRSVRARQ